MTSLRIGDEVLCTKAPSQFTLNRGSTYTVKKIHPTGEWIKVEGISQWYTRSRFSLVEINYNVEEEI